MPSRALETLDLPEARDTRHVIWLVDDSPLEAEVGRRSLEATHDVVHFAEATAMLEALASAPSPSAVVLDWQMPGLPGLEACKFIRTTRSQNALPILMLTGLSDPADLVEAMSAGANDYLTKPYAAVELLARVTALVRTKTLHDRLLAAETRERGARLEAQAANQAKDEFLALVSHELRTPLNAILGWVQLMRLGRLDASGYFRAAETIERNAKAQVQLIEDILDGTRIMTGRSRLELARVDVSGVLRAAIESTGPAVDKKSLSLKLDLDVAPAWVNGDADRIQQVLGNLLSNAIKFTPKGGHIEVRAARIEDEVVISVHDDGIGIAPEVLPLIFERFRQAEGTASRRYGGLGIGLSLVQHFVEAHGGTVVAASEGLGRGATFVVTLPAVPPAPGDSGARTSGVPSGDVATLAGLDVLVVDDEADGRELIAAGLRAHGVLVRTANSAEQALELVGAARPDVIVSDIAMPVVDGFEFLKRLRGRPDDGRGSVPVLALTAFARDEHRGKALEAGFDMWLAKPVNPSVLASAVAELASRPPHGRTTGRAA
jgi:signal transduction histidine kinase